MPIQLLHQLRVGLRRHWLYFGGWLLKVLGAMWLVIEGGSFFSSEFRKFSEDNYLLLFAVMCVATSVAMWKSRALLSVNIPLKGTNTDLIILFGDIFASQTDHIAIPVNEYFDGELGIAVDQKSVHGQFIKNFYDGNQRDFEKICDTSLSQNNRKKTERKGRSWTYPIGTTIPLALGGRKAFLFVLTNTDPITLKANADVPILWEALSGLWKSIRNNANGNCVSIPLVGAGQSGVGIDPMHLLNFLMLSAHIATREKEITKKIKIILHKDMFEKIDLLAIKKDWD